MGVAAVTYGELLQRSGKVVVMGDLWLPSVIVSGDDLRIIDWELAHYGHPSQDVGHLAAHLWMHMHRPPSASTAENAMNMLKGFLENYRIALGEEFNRIFGSEGLQESSIHFGSEILARTVGTFQEGYLYQGLPWDHADIQEAILMAASHITNPTSAGIFEPLQV
jgi:5-methylthioribose kinase